ncbi:MAG: metallochaperone AztD [Devosia sp.]|nr:metallochaperone AztD [Devosia sp.]
MPRLLHQLILPAMALSFCVTPASAEEEATFWRLFVADHGKPLVTAIDLGTDQVSGSFELGSPASLYTTPSKAAVFAVQGEADRVSAIASGIALGDHGDHADLVIAAPKLLDAAVAGDKPVHFVEHHGDIALFFDGEGVARLVSERDWLAGNAATRDLKVAAPHHGVAAPLGDYTLISRPNAEDPKALPVGIDVYGADGATIGDLHACPDLHGEASSGDTLAIACAAGLLLVKQAKAGPELQLLPYPASLPEGKSTTLLGGVAMQYWLGNYGADRVAIIDPSAAAPFRLVDLPSRRVHFVIDPQRVKYAYIFTEDGALHRLDVVSGALDRTLPLTQPYSMDGEWSLPRPRLAVAGDHIAVTDPLAGAIHLVDAESFALVRDIAVAGVPYNIVAVGGSGASHE